MPPPGGFEPIKYRRSLPFRGPSGAVVLAGVAAVCAFGFYKVGQGNLERRELRRENTWSRIHLVPLLLAEGDRDAYRREQAAQAREREIMKDVRGWEAGGVGGLEVTCDLSNLDVCARVFGWMPDSYERCRRGTPVAPGGGTVDRAGYDAGALIGWRMRCVGTHTCEPGLSAGDGLEMVRRWAYASGAHGSASDLGRWNGMGRDLQILERPGPCQAGARTVLFAASVVEGTSAKSESGVTEVRPCGTTHATGRGGASFPEWHVTQGPPAKVSELPAALGAMANLLVRCWGVFKPRRETMRFRFTPALLPPPMATHVWHDESPAARAFAAFDSSWASPNAMLNTDDLGHELPNPFAPATPENMIFGLDDVLSEQTQAQTALPRTGMLGWEAEPMAAYTNFDQLGLDDSDLDPSHGHFYLSHPGSFSGSPSSWDVGPGFNIDPPQTPDSPSLTQDSFGVSPGLAPPFSPQPQIATSLPTEHPFTVGQPRPRTRSSVRIPARRTNTHSHSFSSHLRTSTAQSPPMRPTLHMRAMSHSAAMLSRPTNLSMSPRTLRNNTLDAALAQTDAPLHFHHVIAATPYSSSAPSRPPAPIAIAAGKSHRSPTPDGESAGEEEDPSRKRKHSPEVERPTDLAPPLRSRLHPPKQAPSTWQIFFTEYLQNYKNTNPERKLNVSQAAKDGGAAYKALTSEQKEIYKRKARLAKEEYERELAAWQRMLTPNDIRTENAYRAAQRKAGKSRRSNLKDPNAPKKPLSAYFMFLQWIRADQARVIEVFGDETETTRQSVLAAAKWRTLSDAEKKPFLAQAEREKLDYEAARKEYEERTSGIANPGPYTGTGYMRIQSSASSGWHHTSADSGPDGLQLNLGGRRSSASSNGKMAGGASFGALMFAPSPVFDEDIAESNEGDVFGQWKAE